MQQITLTHEGEALKVELDGVHVATFPSAGALQRFLEFAHSSVPAYLRLRLNLMLIGLMDRGPHGSVSDKI